MNQPTLTHIERGTRSIYDFEMIVLVNVLQVDVRWLLGLSEESTP